MNRPVLNELFHDNSAVMLLINPANGAIIDANHSAENFYGYTRKEFSSMNIGDINIMPRKDIRKQLTAIRDKKISYPSYKHRLKNGSIRDIKVLESSFRLNNIPVNFAIIEDITNELKYQEELAKFKSIADNSVAMIGVANMNRQVVYINKKMRQVFGIADEDDISTLKIFDFYSAKGKKLVRTQIDSIVQKGYWQGENEMQSPEGTLIPILQTVTVVKDAEGKPLFTSMMAIDISNEKNAEKKLRASEGQLKQAELIGKTGNLIFNTKTGLYTLSEGAKKIYGIRKKEITVKDITSLRVPGQAETLDKALKDIIAKNEPVELVYHIKRKSDNKRLTIQAKSQHLPRLNVIITILRDISEQTKHEKEITELNKELRGLNDYLQRVRREERNKFAKEVHDKIGQKLVMLKFQAEQIKKTLQKNIPAGSDDALEGLSANISDMLLDFQKIYSEVKTVVLSHLTLAEALWEMGNFLIIKNNITLDYHTALDKQEFDSITRSTLMLFAEQCLDNIVKHAAASMVNISLLKQKDRLILTITDNGKGFNYAKVKMNKYGLLQVRELVNSIGGKLTITSKPGEGTTVSAAVPFA